MWGSQARKVVKGRPLEKGKGKPLEKGKEEEKGKGKPLGKGKEEEKGKGKPLGKGKEEEEEEEEEGEYIWKPFLGKYRWVKPDHNRMYRRAGTGTTSWKRRAGRVDKQWSSLAEQNSPETVEGLEEQKDKLQKALEKAEKRLEERKQEESSSSSESTKPPKKSGKLGPRLGEVKEEDPPDWSAMEEIQDFSIPLEKGKSLEKDQADSKPLEKGSSSSSKPQQKAMPKPKQQPSSTPYQPTLNLRSRPGFSQASSSSEPLKKGKGKGEPLEKGEKGKKSLEKDKQAPDELLEKSKETARTVLLEKGKEQNIWRGLHREVLIVDWHNTLEVQDFLPDYNRVALGKAMRAADIHVISWVGSEHREHTAMRQMRSMLPNHKALLSFSTTRVKIGRGGKVFLGKKHMADSIFDDQPAILKEALERGMEIWAIQHPHEDHSWLKELGMGHRVFRTFAEAVDAWLYYRGFEP